MTDTLLIVLTLNLIGVLSPGPDMLLLIRHSAGKPLACALYCIAGVSLGLCVHLTLAVLGLAVLLTTVPELLLAIQYLGAAYLIVLGCKAWRSAHRAPDEESSADSTERPLTCLRQGLLCNLLNPKVTLFMFSLFTQVITPDTQLDEKLVYALVMLAQTILLWTLLVLALKFPALQRWFARYRARLNRAAGAGFVGLGGSMLIAS